MKTVSHVMLDNMRIKFSGRSLSLRIVK